MNDSDFAALEAKKAKRIHFNPEINAEHVLTTITLVAGMFIGWTQLDKRVVVLEESRNAQQLRDRYQDDTVSQRLQQINESLTEIKRNVDRVNDKLEKRQ